MSSAFPKRRIGRLLACFREHDFPRACYRGCSYFVMFRVAVGTAVTRCPPHRPVLALLVHTVPTLDVWRRSARWDKDVRFGRKESGQQAAPESAPRSNGSVDSAAEAGAAITAAHLSETPSVDARCPEQRDIGNTPSPLFTTGYANRRCSTARKPEGSPSFVR